MDENFNNSNELNHIGAEANNPIKVDNIVQDSSYQASSNYRPNNMQGFGGGMEQSPNMANGNMPNMNPNMNMGANSGMNSNMRPNMNPNMNYGGGSESGRGTAPNMQQGMNTAAPKAKPKKEKKKSSGKGKRVVGLIASAFVFGIVAGGVTFGVNYAGNKLFPDKKDSQSTTQIATVTASDSNDTKTESTTGVADVVDQVMPSIVSISNVSVQRVQTWFQSYEQEVLGAGSGFIIGQTDDEVLVVTNNHVVDDSKEITVTFFDDASVEGVVKGTDSDSDLAVVAVKTSDMNSDTLSKIKVAALGSSENLRVGESAIAIGNALGYGQSVTVGYISALNRKIQAAGGSSLGMIQTDAAINPGNSGGALLNTKGEVIGINSAKYMDTEVEGMGYAIPISDAIPIVNDLMNKEVLAEDEQGYLGISGNDVTDEYAKNFNMPKGVYVVKIVDGSPAADADIKAGDIITSVDGKEITSMEKLQEIISGKKAGEEVEVILQRSNSKGEYEENKIKVKLGTKPDDQSTNNSPDSNNTPDQNSNGSSNDSDDDFGNYMDSYEDFLYDFFGH